MVFAHFELVFAWCQRFLTSNAWVADAQHTIVCSHTPIKAVQTRLQFDLKLVLILEDILKDILMSCSI